MTTTSQPSARTPGPRRTPLSQLFNRRPSYRQHPLRAWPYTWASLGRFAIAFVILTAAFTAVGFAITSWWEPSALGQQEAELSEWLEEQRTDSLNTVAKVLSVPSNTGVKIALAALLGIALPVVFRRWHDWAFLIGALLLEVSVYGTAGYLVGRERPDVERLSSAPTQSFPSGHMAAAVTFYIGLVLIVYWNTRNPTWRRLAGIVGLAIPAGMFVSRLYLGMHFVTDMLGGIVLGVLSLIVALNIARDGLEASNDDVDEIQEPQVQRLDLTTSPPTTT